MLCGVDSQQNAGSDWLAPVLRVIPHEGGDNHPKSSADSLGQAGLRVVHHGELLGHTPRFTYEDQTDLRCLVLKSEKFHPLVEILHLYHEH